MLALYIIGGLLVLLVAVLSVPVDMRMRIIYPGGSVVTASVRWLFGLVTVHVIPGKRHEKAVRVEPEKKPRKKGRGPGFRTILEILRTRGLATEFKRLVKAVIHRIHIRNLAADIAVGLDDPAETGMLFAVVGPAVACVSHPAVHDVRLTPLPDAAAVRGNCSGTVRLWPVSFVPPLARFIFSVPVLRSAKTVILETWKNRRRS